MIEITREIKEKIDEKELFNSMAEMLFEEEIDGNGNMVNDLPIDAQRLIFTKVGAMIIDYAESEDFGK